MSFLNQPVTNILIKPKRQLGNISLPVVISENTVDQLTITKQPVQTGASLTDHSFKEPTVMTMAVYFQALLDFNSFVSLGEVYQELLDLQKSRIPFDVVTPKRIYKSMLLQSITNTTDKNTENTLAVIFTLQEVILVDVAQVTVPRSKQKAPQVTAKTESAGKKSAIQLAADAIAGRQ